MRYAACRLEPGKSGHDAGWELLERLYREETGCPLPDVIRTSRGHPRFVGSHLCFSIAHTSRHAFCVLSCKPVGIDAEELDRPVRLSLAEKILSPGEMEQFRRTEDKRRALLTFWVLKEAAAKRTGQGLTGFPNHTSFRLNDPNVHEWDGCLVAVSTEE